MKAFSDKTLGSSSRRTYPPTISAPQRSFAINGTTSSTLVYGATRHRILELTTTLSTVIASPSCPKTIHLIFAVALTRFKRTLPRVRPSVRSLTHTLHLPPAHAEIYGGPHYEWLRDCCERLPHLQSLIVHGLPFFDHAALMTLRHPSVWRQNALPNSFPVFSLRLLDASGCTNATSSGLAEALRHFPDLVYLDLSKTHAAKNEDVFRAFKFLRNLRVLKLSGLRLTDDDLAIVTPSIGMRVRSLDMTGNMLTDKSARLLLAHCFKEDIPPITTNRSPQTHLDSNLRADGEDILGSTDLEIHVARKLTEGFIGSLAVENTGDIGITEIRISKNCMSVEGVSALLRSKRLNVLDAGTLAETLHLQEHSKFEPARMLALPGPEKLTPLFNGDVTNRLKYLRIGYALITKDAPTETPTTPRAEMEGDRMAPAHPPWASELEAIGPTTYELPETERTVYELEATTEPQELHANSAHPEKVKIPGSRMVGNSPTPEIKITAQAGEVNPGPAFAPELVLQDPVSPLNATGGLSPLTPVSPMAEETGVSTASRRRHSSISFVDARRVRLDLRQTREDRLHPGMLPKVHTLVLTDVPTKTTDSEVVHRLIQFIKDCAEEATIAQLRAKHTYILPPGRSRPVAEREYAESLFALKRIIFEMAPPPAPAKGISSSWRQYPTLSSTEDPDSETFWQAATSDFSFFGDEECGLPELDPDMHLPTADMSGLMLADEEGISRSTSRERKTIDEPAVDIVAEIGKFRREVKAEYQRRVQLGELEPNVDGYWAGDITVVRPPVDLDSGSVDFYGNRYERGWLYR